SPALYPLSLHDALPISIQAFAQRAGTSEVTGFVFVGYAMYMWLSAMLWGPGSALRTEQLRGSLEAIFLTPTSRLVPLFAPPVAALPAIILDFAVIFPAMWLLFGVVLPVDAMLRAVAGDLIFVVALTVIVAVLASVVFRWLDQSARRTGMLGRY